MSSSHREIRLEPPVGLQVWVLRKPHLSHFCSQSPLRPRANTWQGSAHKPFLFAYFIDSLTGSKQKEAPWDMLFANDVLSGETKEEVDEKLEEWRAAVEDRGMRVSRKKSECLFMEDPGMKPDKLDGVTEFKYIGSTE
ncbi:uncharacterized protein LOC125025530 [Penaeus chinensis]|uniref:uncharacterized protein LOC125025530 n=1 Tax=Penaeus chinensis TaxID=139456 RepID=UPI001FB57537|nr:uncharacterized protein LOC125025530 [Penaeus chinensis]